MAYRIKLGDEMVTYTIRESKRARRLRLKIDQQNGLQVVVPSGAKPKGIETVLREHQAWVLEHLRRVNEMPTERPSRQYVTGEKLPFLGEDHELEVITTHAGKRTVVVRQGKLIRVRLQARIAEGHRTAVVRAVLEAWYRYQAKHYLEQRAYELAAQHGFQFGKITIRDQKTRWGSCSSKGNLNFSWRLMMAPLGAIDYLIIHELCHLREMNHSQKFWALVAYYCADYKRWKRWFKEQARLLYL
jgi:predicted metal-dependent hydrolase